MIDTELLDVINSGDAWVFIGSGISMDAGLPSWAGLVDLAVTQFPSKKQEEVAGDSLF